ncbi:MAG: hypothetical protein J5601_05265, partial [Elusimicrobiaceae bacterium]|nr:hypothetical protein [Elusimicrobiaceae bacterium]
MKKSCVLWMVFPLLMAGCCYCQKEAGTATETIIQTQPENPPLAEDTPPVEIQTAVPEKSVIAVAAKPTATTEPSAKEEKPVTAEVKKTTAPSKTAPVSTEKSTTVFDTTAAKQLIQQKRSAQTLQTPQADETTFKNEELIPTGNRLLGPLSYEPVVQTKTTAPWSKEELKYGVYYSFVKAGTAYIKNRGLVTLGNKQAYLIQTTAFSASVIDSVFKVRDVNYSWL